MKIEKCNLNKILLNSSLILLGFIFLDHLIVMLLYIVNSMFLPFVFPLSLAISILIYLYTEKSLYRKEKIWTIIVSLFVIFSSLLLSAFYFDFSWDGQWYHQSAIYHLESDWNPIFEPIRTFEKNNDTPIIHFPKGSWYFAASVFSTFGHFESGKCINFILLFVAFAIIYSTVRDYKLSILKSITIASLVIINPVVWSETTTYLVDGLLFLYLSIYIVMVFTWYSNPNKKSMLIGAMAIVGMINVKFTGLVFFCVLAFFAASYGLIYKRQYLVKFIIKHVAALIISVFIFGFNPYVTNFIQRGHPLYPIMGTEKFPSVFEETGEDSNEKYETPHNMCGRHLLVRMFYSNFGRPDNAPYHIEKDAKLIWPFTSSVSDWKAYHFHETRVSGFGPYFSGIFILSFILLLIILKVDKKSRWIVSLLFIALFSSLLFSKHFWWPRFGPQMWLIPLIPVCFSFFRPVSKKSYYTWIIAVLLFINGSIVAFSHMDWETRSSKELRKKLAELQKKNMPIEIHYGWFKKSMDEKLDKWYIKYTTLPGKTMKEGNYKELPSVVEGYPNMVIYREQEKE